MTPEGDKSIKRFTIQDAFYLGQRQIQLAVEQDLLQAQKRPFVVVAIAVLRHPGRVKQPDLVIVMKRAGGDACQGGELSTVYMRSV